jgi:hypothetical protein
MEANCQHYRWLTPLRLDPSRRDRQQEVREARAARRDQENPGLS